MKAVKNAENIEDVLEDSTIKKSSKIVGQAVSLQNVFRAIGKISNSDITVLIRGESGTGKELIAQAVHDNSLRKDKPFVAINVAAIPHELLESELFGHEKGAFTGAQAQRTGRFEQALGGTLFLDEIGDMHPELQTRLLRVLSSQEFYRVGGHKPIKSDVRIIAATNQSIEELIKTSKFREDLYHRLNVFKLELPPLRQRKEDIPSLISHFLKTAAIELNTEQKMINKKTMTFLEAFDWPGNIRQLENTCRYLTVMSASSIISMDDLPQDIFNDKGLDENQKSHDLNWQASLEDFIRSEIESDKNILKKVNSEIEKILIDESLRASNGIKLEAAKLLGWGRNTLARKAKNT
jgi:two-component system nitrogen regulation response regulator GlnG